MTHIKEKMGIFRSVVTAMVVAIRGVVKYGFYCIINSLLVCLFVVVSFSVFF